MSQQQPQRDQHDLDPIKYGDVFNVHGNLASTPITPEDAKSMQAAENSVLGQTPKGSPASVMQSAAALNVKAGLIDPHDDLSVNVRDQGMTVTKDTIGGGSVVTESIAGQIVAQYFEPTMPRSTPGSLDSDAVTIGEALQATAIASGDRPIDQSDAAAIQAAEVRATGINEVLPGGVGAEAQSAASHNSKAVRDDDKTKISDVLDDAKMKLPIDKAVTKEDAERVVEAEVRNKADYHATPSGVGVAMAAAARLNERK